MKLRIQYVGVVALRRGRTKKRAWERVLALAGGARGGQLNTFVYLVLVMT
jgi:hypothetical protein